MAHFQIPFLSSFIVYKGVVYQSLQIPNRQFTKFFTLTADWHFFVYFFVFLLLHIHHVGCFRLFCNILLLQLQECELICIRNRKTQAKQIEIAFDSIFFLIPIKTM